MKFAVMCFVLSSSIAFAAEEACKPVKFKGGEMIYQDHHLVAKGAKGKKTDLPEFDRLSDCLRMEASKFHPDYIEVEYYTPDVGTSVIASDRRLAIIDTQNHKWILEPFAIANRVYSKKTYTEQAIGTTEWREAGKSLWFIPKDGNPEQLWPKLAAAAPSK